MTTAILTIVASILSWAASTGIDKLIGKWVAYASIAWENHASQNARDGFREGIEAIAQKLPEKYEGWKAWRQKSNSVPPSST